jgi:ATP-dependent Clp protease ATP-binding subunit ClpC
MFERFTDRARRVVVLAQNEARALGHDYIGSEHLLLGLIGEGSGTAAKALESLGVSAAELRAGVAELVATGEQSSSGHIPFTPQAKQVLRLALGEAQRLGHNYVGTEHLLLALIQERNDVAGQVLAAAGADLGHARAEVVRLLAEYQQRARPDAEGNQAPGPGGGSAEA